jgi:hypothetical protein
MVIEVTGFVDRESGCYLAGEDILVTVCLLFNPSQLIGV